MKSKDIWMITRRPGYQTFISGLVQIIDGITQVVTLGFVDSSWNYQYSLYCIRQTRDGKYK